MNIGSGIILRMTAVDELIDRVPPAHCLYGHLKMSTGCQLIHCVCCADRERL